MEGGNNILWPVNGDQTLGWLEWKLFTGPLKVHVGCLAGWRFFVPGRWAPLLIMKNDGGLAMKFNTKFNGGQLSRVAIITG